MSTAGTHAQDAALLNDGLALSAHVRELQRARRHGEAWLPLRGKILGLLCASEETEEAQRFRRAATQLGARVAWVRPSLDSASGVELIQATSRVLAQLYDAVECQGIDTSLVRQLGSGCSVPIFDELVASRPLGAALSKILGETDSPEERSLLLLQASLLNALA